MVNFIMVKVPLAVGIWAVPWYDMPSSAAEPATMTDVAVDASMPGVPAAVLDFDWLPEVDPADVLGCGALPGPGEEPGVEPAPASAEVGWVAAGVGPGLGAGEVGHRIQRTGPPPPAEGRPVGDDGRRESRVARKTATVSSRSG
jgi:hypothetical protein